MNLLRESRLLPNFIGIGVTKAATTWIYNCLKEHPDIFVSEVKETNFFAYDTIENRLDEYKNHFTHSTGYKAVGEISTTYFIYKEAPQRIKKYIPNAKLILSLRNPLNQVYSHYWHLKRQNFHQWNFRNIPKDFDQAVDTYSHILIENALYYKYISYWLKFFDITNIKIVFFEDIKISPLNVVKDLYEFLEVDNEFVPQAISNIGYSSRKGRSPRNKINARIYASIYVFITRFLYQNIKLMFGVKKAMYLKDKLKIRFFLEKIFMRDGYPKMPEVYRVKLYNLLRDDIDNLEKLLNKDLKSWKI